MCVRPACYIPESNNARRQNRARRAIRVAIELACLSLFLGAMLVWSYAASLRFAGPVSPV